MSVDLTLGEVPSFLNNTCEYLYFILCSLFAQFFSVDLSACHYSQPVVVVQDQDT